MEQISSFYNVSRLLSLSVFIDDNKAEHIKITLFPIIRKYSFETIFILFKSTSNN